MNLIDRRCRWPHGCLRQPVFGGMTMLKIPHRSLLSAVPPSLPKANLRPPHSTPPSPPPFLPDEADGRAVFCKQHKLPSQVNIRWKRGCRRERQPTGTGARVGVRRRRGRGRDKDRIRDGQRCESIDREGVAGRGQELGSQGAGQRHADMFGDADVWCSPFYFGNFLPYEVGGWAMPLSGACS